MSNYAWMRPGVLAVIQGAKNIPEVNGTLVTLTGYPKQDCGRWQVTVEEQREFTVKYGKGRICTGVACSVLRPYKEPPQELYRGQFEPSGLPLDLKQILKPKKELLHDVS